MKQTSYKYSASTITPEFSCQTEHTGVVCEDTPLKYEEPGENCRKPLTFPGPPREKAIWDRDCGSNNEQKYHEHS